ncbi:MAG: HAD-IIA family hydrolase [Actinomycetales bacterium]|nr:HAD-IIA family hydrolase [Actinomycetales bacterium]
MTRPEDRPTHDVLLDDHDALLLDLDGVVYVGPHAVPHAVEAITAARARGVTAAYVTNNAARPPAVVAEHLRELGLDVTAHDVVTSAQAGAREVAARVPVGSRVLAVGGPGVAEALRDRGLEPVSRYADGPAAVLMGYGPDVGWRELAEASYAVGAGALFVATNTDMSIPTDQGMAPGNGAFVAAVVSASGREPLVAGKPRAPLLVESVERVGARSPLVVGDRLDTDIEAGHVCGIPTLLVLTGVTDVATLLAAPPDRRPTYLAADLRGLLAAPGDLVLAGTGADGVDGLAALRAGCRRAWAARDEGRPDPTSAADLARWSADVAAALAR